MTMSVLSIVYDSLFTNSNFLHLLTSHQSSAACYNNYFVQVDYEMISGISLLLNRISHDDYVDYCSIVDKLKIEINTICKYPGNFSFRFNQSI